MMLITNGSPGLSKRTGSTTGISTPSSSTVLSTSTSTLQHTGNRRSQRHGQGRSSKQSRGALLRDARRCVLSGAFGVEVAHIFPYATRNSSEKSKNIHFLKLLHLFCGHEEALKVELYLGLGTEMNPGTATPLIHGSHPINRQENLITLQAGLHKFFGKGALVLEPIGDPLSIFDAPAHVHPHPQLTSYQVRITYLPLHRAPSKGWDLTTAGYSGAPVPVMEDEDSDLCWRVGTDLAEGHEGELVFLRSGMVILLRTDDPVKRPLPHPDLLRLHAGLSRVVRGAGAGAGDDDEDWDDSDWWEEEETEVDRENNPEEGENDLEQREPSPGVEQREPSPQLPVQPPRRHSSDSLLDARIRSYLDTVVTSEYPPPPEMLTPPPSSPIMPGSHPRLAPLAAVASHKRTHSLALSATPTGSSARSSPVRTTAAAAVPLKNKGQSNVPRENRKIPRMWTGKDDE